jgi:AcrR family transcriptional regulator
MPLTHKGVAERDHRTAIADKKRSETRARLLNAALVLCVGHRGHLPTVEDVVARAKVSRGTFYKYFDSIEAALSALGHDLTRLSSLEGERFRGVFSDKWKSTSVALRTLMTRALLDPTWADLALRTRGWVGDAFFAELVMQDLAEGRVSGEYRVRDDQVAFDFLCGLIESCAASLHRGVPDPERYIDAVIHTWLQALGVEARHCDEGVTMSKKFLSDYISGELQPFLTPEGPAVS